MDKYETPKDQPVYYHYLGTEHAISDLERGWMKVSRIGELNDPFEFMPHSMSPDRTEEKEYERILHKEIAKQWGVLSFSRTWNHILLWAHYADSHRGIALGFRISGELLRKVCYCPVDKRPQINLTGNPSMDHPQFLRIGTVKSKDWIYEQEVRIIPRLTECKYMTRPGCISILSETTYYWSTWFSAASSTPSTMS